ncbi:MAG TPA: YlxR family protein [Trueperaceae bacterium]|nr:YlxR family protein [Trueperaceae bacterium]
MASAKSRHVPLRRCVLCRASLPKAELIRLVRGADGGFELDPAGRAGGRGTWVCRSCAEEPTEKRLRQAFRGQAERVRELLAHARSGRPRAGAEGAPAEGIGTEA